MLPARNDDVRRNGIAVDTLGTLGRIGLLALLAGCAPTLAMLPARPAQPEIRYLRPSDPHVVAGLTQDAMELLRERDQRWQQHIEVLEQQLRDVQQPPWFVIPW